MGGKKHWITTQLHTRNTHTSCLTLTTHSFIQIWLPCGPPCRRLARCCRRRQTSPHFQAADTQNGLFIALMRWRDEACCLCYRLNTHWTPCGQQPRVWTRCLQACPVLERTCVRARPSANIIRGVGQLMWNQLWGFF